MKKTVLILVSLAFLVGCSDDTPPTTPSGGTISGALVGVWNFTSINQENGKIKLDGVDFATYTSTSSNETGTFEFKSDGSVTNTISYNAVVTTVVAGIPTEQSGEIPTTTTNGTYVWDKTNNKITITPTTGAVSIMEIRELTANKFVGVQAFTRTQVQDGVTQVTSADVVLTLTK
jgi:hypothetical protein